MKATGEAIVDGTGRLVRVDPGFAGLLRTVPEALVGKPALDITAPADRERCESILQTLMIDRKPVSTVKRLIRADGSHLWVTNALIYVDEDDGGPGCRITVRPAGLSDDWIEPNKLLRIAKFIEHSRRHRAAAFNSRLFNDPAWDILLLAYIREGEGDVIYPHAVFAEIGVPLASGIRWMRALIAEGLIVCEDGRLDPAADCAFRLTSDAHARIERYLADLYGTLTPEDRLNMPA